MSGQGSGPAVPRPDCSLLQTATSLLSDRASGLGQQFSLQIFSERITTEG